jgi:hypothetical protein
MTPYEFGYAVGATEKSANFGTNLLIGALTHNPLVHAGLGAAGYAPVGAALGAYRAPQGQKLRGAGRGALTGAAAGATGGAASALAAKAIGGIGGIIARGIQGGAKNHLINQMPNLAGIGGLVGGYQLAKQRPQTPQLGQLSPQRSQPGRI